MSNGEDGAFAELLPDSGLDQVIGLQIDGRCRFIQDEDLGLPQEGAPQAHQLTLTHTQVLAALIHLLVWRERSQLSI